MSVSVNSGFEKFCGGSVWVSDFADYYCVIDYITAFCELWYSCTILEDVVTTAVVKLFVKFRSWKAR
jgi:hypothetical protein